MPVACAPKFRNTAAVGVLAISLAGGGTEAQSGASPRTPFDGPARTTLSSPALDIPLTKIGQFYYVDVQLNGQRFRMTLETGAGFFGISSRAAKALGLRVDTVEVMPGSRSAVATIDSLTMPGVSFATLVARVNPAWDTGDFDGIISIPLLRQLLATVDLGASRLRLERGALPAPNGRDVMAIAGKDRGRRIDFEVRLGDVPTTAVLDTRSFLSIIVPDSLERVLKLSDTPRQVGNARGPSLGTFTLNGAHLSADARFGSYGVRRPAIVLRNRPGVVVGVPFIEQFVITIDQQNQRIRFARPGRDAIAVVAREEWESTPTSEIAAGPSGSGPVRRVAGPAPTARPMGFNLAGPGGSDLVVMNLVPGSNADRAGLRNGGRLVEFDGTPVASMSPTVFRAAVGKDGPVKVVVTRDGTQMEFMILPQPDK